MIEIRYVFPVRFPEYWQRTAPKAARIDANFAKNISITDALKYLQEELDQSHAHKAVIYSNFENLPNDRSRSKKGHSEGITLEFSVGNTTAHLSCDKWYHIQQNIYALHLAVRHLRLFEDWGIATAEFMMSPFSPAIHAHHTHLDSDDSDDRNRRELDAPWRRLLGLGETATLDDANAVYRSRAKKVSDDEDALIELNKAIEIARQSL